MPFLFNDSKLKSRRRELRRNQTEAEKIIWRYLRGRSMEGMKFFRQYGVGSYILDFYCPRLSLAIEIDGGQHMEESGKIHDAKRADFLSSKGIKIMRFGNNEVMKNKQAVLEMIRHYIITHPIPPLS
ncbi:MAG: hypothetical protein UV40_C0004G0002 [Parcubacteria group bacterium GW2011_GWA1_42_7]|nr:MAG: hypothetical protein UV34_C0046G0001 [Parcubacteria group bacterium GW2011_GWB1_42_6]KKS70129.1 MAG: hypothetical protein UV40_C0004G0002 [Parcubacteria group bacterium GW2011_GWA1_42_7]KKS91810.1 MAG: hypothetical protein UV67_C0017G0005 [Parcubacteria group bacterium GW2011_GWC1_43_12]